MPMSICSLSTKVIQTAVTFQLLRYMVRIWEKERDKTGLVSPIIPLVVYHGRVKWNFSTRFTGLFEDLQPDTLNSLRNYLPEFHYQLTDLSPFSDTEIQGEIWSRIFQLILRYIFDDELGQRLPGILSLAGELAQQGSGLEMLVTILRYVSRAGRGATREDIRRAVMAVIPNDGGVLLKTAAEEWIEEGIAKGFQQGIEQGLEQGIEQGLERGVQAQRTTLGLFLQRRFNPTEPELVTLNQQLSQIHDLDQLTQLFNHALDAADLADFVQRLNPYLPATDQQAP